jgi:SAM-dependent methyltransferase
MSSNDAWRSLSKDYETARGRHDSLDRLLEWAAQRDLMGTIEGKDILDVGCGNGEKAIELGCRGARSVLGLDIAANFLTPPSGLDVTLAAGDLSDLGSVPSVQGRTFDKVLFLQSLGYAADQVATLRAARSLVRDDGVLIVSRAHPIRFAVERSERDNIGLGDAYHATDPYSYQSGWNTEVSLTHATDTFSSMVNSLVAAGFWIEKISEPKLSEEQKEKFPAKQAWLARYVGIIIFRARPNLDLQ